MLAKVIIWQFSIKITIDCKSINDTVSAVKLCSLFKTSSLHEEDRSLLLVEWVSKIS